ncbi:hypothetical protein [Hyphomonas pacifica]|uniref:Uncharacterized protein n=1 Tax=Hyphomonas pacifica TaxID=1280941 RepID=A0A062U507_9PROT|nr:hypothetical protein [Hyphomonas pacifica]KCZ52848.1 hypothetical protein HY2_06885 [Hyphomonas pacifica]RAN35312.1 hypothetical protein HY3_08415 [Hyphomonas pacifica]
MILFVGWAIAVITVAIGYVIAGPIWVKRHSLRFRVGHTLRRCSGMYGEIALVTFGAMLVYLIDQSSPSTTVDELVMARPMVSLGAVILVALVVYVHGIRTAMAAETGERGRLGFTYSIYGVFSTVFFAGGLALIALVVTQALADASNFSELSKAAIAQLPMSGEADTDTLQRGLELSYLDTQLLLSKAEDSMSPVFVFMAGIFAINLAIRLTPLRSLFINNAVLLTMVTTIIGVIAVLVVGAWTYIGYYSSFINDYLEALTEFRGFIVKANPDALERYSDIYVEMIDQKALLGFVTRISNEWGGVAAVLGVTQWIVEQFNRPEQEESPAHAHEPAEA